VAVGVTQSGESLADSLVSRSTKIDHTSQGWFVGGLTDAVAMDPFKKMEPLSLNRHEYIRSGHKITVVILFLAGYVLSPVMLTWGWVRWFRQPKLQTVTAILSLLGFILASASALLAVSAMAYSLMRGGFPFYDPLLMRIFGVGGLLSLGGLVFGVGGAWRASSLRWHAPVSAIATLAFWIAAAIGE